MRLNSLILRNFALHRDLRMEFDRPITMILGENDTGKSTVKDAINYALRGVCLGLDENGAGMKEVVTHGEEPESLEVIADTTNGVFARKAAEGPRSKVGHDLAQKIGVSPGMLALCLEWDTILRAPDKDARRVLLGCLGVKLTSAVMQQILGEEDYLYIGPHIKEGDIDSIGVAYGHVYARRREVGRVVKGYAPSDFVGYSEKIRGMTAAQARAAMEGARKTLSGLEKALHDATVESASTAATRAEIMVQKRGHEELIKAWGIDLDEYAQLAKDIPKAQAQVDKDKAAYLALTKDLLEIEKGIAATEALIIQGNEEVARLHAKTSKGECPTCRRPGMTTSMVKQASGLYAKEIRANELALKKQNKGREKGEDLVRTSKGTWEASAAALVTAEEAGESIRDLREQIKGARDSIAEIDARMKGMPDGEPKPKEGEDGGLELVRQRIGNGNAIVAELGRYIQAREDAERLTAQYGTLRAEYDTCERLVKLLAPTGKVYTDLIATKIEPFEQRLNAILKPMNYMVAISLDPFDIRGAKIGRPLSSARWNGRLCTSGKLRLALALQSAVAIYSGLGIVVMDEADRIDFSSQRGLAGSCMEAISAGVEQVIICATLARPRATWRPPEDREGISPQQKAWIEERIQSLLMPEPEASDATDAG